MNTKIYETRICLECGCSRQVRKWTNPSGICRSCAGKKAHPSILPDGFIHGEEIGKARQTIYTKMACPQCNKSRWCRVYCLKTFLGTLTPSRLCRLCANKNLRGRQSANRMERNGMWKGGRCTTGGGYVKIKVSPSHPYYEMASASDYIMEHRLAMAIHLGRCLKPEEIIHHISQE